MRILNFGSLNLDYVYSVPHIVQPGETISSTKLEFFCGGKGLNQSVALARAGAEVYHAGMIGSDGEILRETCTKNGVDTRYIKTVPERSGNAIIQVSFSGQNSIVLFGGANQANSLQHIKDVLSGFENGDWLLLQNEINMLDTIIELASRKRMNIALNPSPYNEVLKKCDFGKISLLLMNEIEGKQITGKDRPDSILAAMRKKFPCAKVALTLGKDGAIYMDGENTYRHGIYDVPVVDTTAAGDTFTGYFLASIINGGKPEEALRLASIASSLAVSKMGASDSIPLIQDVHTHPSKRCASRFPYVW